MGEDIVNIIQEAKAYVELHKQNILGAHKSNYEIGDLISRLVDRLEWQPIETAPKDGKQILVYYKNDLGKNRIIKAHYIQKFTEESNEDFAEYSEEKDDYYTPEGWYEDIDNWDDYSHVKLQHSPTHWMPLPLPPVGDK